jgi:outer membrane protein assembly factor BamB
MIGLPDNGQVRVIDTAAGRVVRTVSPGSNQRISVAGGRVLSVTANAQDGTCYYSTTATDPPSGAKIWTHDSLNLRTAENGSSCKQTRDPAGGSDVVLGVDSVGRRELVAAHDGRVLWHGGRGEEVLAVDDSAAVVRSADGRTVRAVTYGSGVNWQRAASDGTTAALAPGIAIVAGTKPARITAISRTGGNVLVDLRTDAKVFAATRTGMILVSGRDMAYLAFR